MIKHFFKNFFLILIITLTSYSTCYADPWMTGPLLAAGGHTIPRGHINFEQYVFFTEIDGLYNTNGKLINTRRSWNNVISPIFSFGLTDRVDVQLGLPYVYNSADFQQHDELADINAVLGYQFLEQRGAKWRPDIRLILQETLPTGTFQGLNPLDNGTDASGLGAYQTTFGIIFQHLAEPAPNHFLRTRFVFNALYASPVNVHGLNVFGGVPETRGKVDPGNLISLDLAAELSLTQNWVGVMEFYYLSRGKTTFRGNAGLDLLGNPAFIGSPMSAQYTIAPALEYNFNDRLGVIGGIWYSLGGKNTIKFHTATIALNFYF